MSQNHVAANLFMFLIIFAGFMSLKSINQEIFPEMEMDMITIEMVYPGASPEEMEESIAIKIEESLEGISEISSIRSVSNEGISVVTAEVEMGEDINEVKDQIKAEIDRITTFPKGSERPVIREMTNSMQVIQVAISGSADEWTIKELAEDIKDDLVGYDAISKVNIIGLRNPEISIELTEHTLRNYGLSFDEVSSAVRRGSLDMPGGSLKTDSGEILVRTKGLGYTQKDYEDINLRSFADGRILKLGDVAAVTDGFEDSDMISSFDGFPAVMVSVYRVGDQDALEVSGIVKTYVKELGDKLPDGLSATIWSDRSKILNERIDLLTRNAMLGLILVLIGLSLFLEVRLALWVAAGIFISFLGTFIVMAALGVTINMITLFAFILVLGIVVDDAIVVGENIFSHQENGMSPAEAASMGTIKISTPVIFAVTTSIVAFMPLLFVEGTMGKIMGAIPVIVISALSFSLIESLFILPAHLSSFNINKTPRWLKPISKLQARIAKGLNNFVMGRYTRFLRLCIQYKWITNAAAIAVFLFSISLLSSGILKFNFMEHVESDNMTVTLTMPPGTSAEQTYAIVQGIEEAALEILKDADHELGYSDKSVFQHIYSTVGVLPSANTMAGPGGGSYINPAIAEVNVELLSSTDRDISSSVLSDRWRERVGHLDDIESITFSSSLMSMGNDIDVELSAGDFSILDLGIQDVKQVLSNYQGVYDIRDDFENGKKELKLQLKPEAATLGLSLQDLARQVRQGLHGEEAFRIQRNKDEVKVMVRYPETERDALSDVSNMRIRTPDGRQIPFYSVASVIPGDGYSQIVRRNGGRVIAVLASVDDDLANANEINNELKMTYLPALLEQYPGLRYSFEGVQKQQSDSMMSLAVGFIIALFVMYGLLAIPFRSYIQPLVIMSAVPFGIIGAIWGHMLFGYNMTMISMFGLVALSGVVINDSLILIDFVNVCRSEGKTMMEAVVCAAQKRFRPIMLTSLTTFLGLTPMILERSFQARFLIPMALSLGFGVIGGTLIILIMVPSSIMIVEDLKHFLARLFGRSSDSGKNSAPLTQGELEGKVSA